MITERDLVITGEAYSSYRISKSSYHQTVWGAGVARRPTVTGRAGSSGLRPGHSGPNAGAQIGDALTGSVSPRALSHRRGPAPADEPAWPVVAGVGHTVAHEAAPRPAGSVGPSGAAPVTPFEDLHAYVAIPRVTGLRLSPDGTWLAATVQQPDPDGKKYSTGIWRIPADGGQEPAAPAS